MFGNPNSILKDAPGYTPESGDMPSDDDEYDTEKIVEGVQKNAATGNIDLVAAMKDIKLMMGTSKRTTRQSTKKGGVNRWISRSPG